uniref:Uncharacterized protein n=1 Tax=Marseillevirus LCMAC103 TaxID=2506604 RepID=A0A481YUW9_9VIRU|nr:MAG: hypothetical protein LCMAC103_03320 [Marseillevirus LCMAC103]
MIAKKTRAILNRIAEANRVELLSKFAGVMREVQSAPQLAEVVNVVLTYATREVAGHAITDHLVANCASVCAEVWGVTVAGDRSTIPATFRQQLTAKLSADFRALLAQAVAGTLGDGEKTRLLHVAKFLGALHAKNCISGAALTAHVQAALDFLRVDVNVDVVAVVHEMAPVAAPLLGPTARTQLAGLVADERRRAALADLTGQIGRDPAAVVIDLLPLNGATWMETLLLNINAVLAKTPHSPRPDPATAPGLRGGARYAGCRSHT